MSASALAKATQRADPVEVFMAMCSANAHLCATDETALLDAVDHLQAAAIKLGLVDMDHVQAIMAEAFAPIREADERAEQAAAAIIPKRGWSAFTFQPQR